MDQNTKLTCPICGTEFKIADHEHFAAGTAIGKDSGLGEIHPELEKKGKNKAEQRLAALRAAGIDTSGLFSLVSAAGDSHLVRLEDNIMKVVAADDPIFAGIMTGGFIPERRLFRRWVMGQTFRLLTDSRGFTDAVHAKGYAYQWKMILDELKAQAKMKDKDPENFAMRNRWMNIHVVSEMASDMYRKIEKTVKGEKIRHFRGKEYIHLRKYGDVLVSDIDTEILTPMAEFVHEIGGCHNNKSGLNRLLKTVEKIYASPLTAILHAQPQCNAWFDAYKGAGAYFTLRNLILFHSCGLKTKKSGDQLLSQSDSLKTLDEIAENYARRHEGWRLFGLMKKTLADNAIDINAKRSEWRTNKMARLYPAGT